MSRERERAGCRFLQAAVLSVFPLCGLAQAEDTKLESRTVELFRTIAPAVVRVNILFDDSGVSGQPEKWQCSGFFIDREGRVLTNLGGSGTVSRVWIEKDGLSYLAELLGADFRTNLALLQVVKLPEKFEIVPIPEAHEPPPVGSFVIGVTSPLELETSPTFGLITGYESSFTGSVFPVTYTRVNVPAGPGEGGAPMVDLNGRLVGISVATIPDFKSTFLLPARALGRIVADLKEHGKVLYGGLPIEFAERPDASNVSRQVVVSSVVPDSSAARADVRPGDIVRRMGSSTVRRVHDVRDALFFSHPGQFIAFEVERDGRRIPFALPIETLPAPSRASAPAEMPADKPPATGPALAPPTRPGPGI